MIPLSFSSCKPVSNLVQVLCPQDPLWEMPRDECMKPNSCDCFLLWQMTFFTVFILSWVFSRHIHMGPECSCVNATICSVPQMKLNAPPPTALSVIVLMDCNDMWYCNREIWKKRRRVWRRGKGIVPCRPIARKENEHSSSQCNKLTKHYIWNLSTTDMFSSFPCDHKEQFVVALARPRVVGLSWIWPSPPAIHCLDVELCAHSCLGFLPSFFLPSFPSIRNSIV